jgi:membrane-bound hydrogenase subunit mbhJ
MAGPVTTVSPIFRRSLAVRHVDTGSCNGCESELTLLGSPAYDFSRFGFSFTPSPRHADALLVTGVVTEAMVPALQAAYDAMPAPKVVVAVGQCALDGHLFRGSPGVIGDLGRVLPVAARVPGCPPSPNDILATLLRLVGREVPSA